MSVAERSKRRLKFRREFSRMSLRDLNASIIEAVSRADGEWTACLLDSGATVTARDDQDKPLLQILLDSGSGDPDLIRTLIERGADVRDVQASTSLTALHLAAKRGYQVCIGLLLSAGARVDAPDVGGNTPLMLACRGRHALCVRMLLSHGSDPDRVNHNGETALHLAVKHGSLSCCRELLSSSSSASRWIDAADCKGFTPLLIAARDDQVEIVNLLLDHPCNVNVQDPETGRTPLHWLAENGSLASVNKLLCLGADAQVRDRDWSTPFTLSMGQGRQDITQALIEAGCDVTTVDRSFNSVLHVAAKDGLVDVIPLCVRAGLDVNLKGSGGMTPLMLAAFAGHENVIQILLELGANVNSLDRNHATALVYALLSPCISVHVVKSLVRFNSDLDEGANLASIWRSYDLHHLDLKSIPLEDRLYSPIEIVHMRGHVVLFKMLLNAGCDVTQAQHHRIVKSHQKLLASKTSRKEDEEFLAVLRRHLERRRKVVRTLKELCRKPTLDQLSRYGSLASIEHSSFPVEIKDFLMFSDLAEPTGNSISPSLEITGKCNGEKFSSRPVTVITNCNARRESPLSRSFSCRNIKSTGLCKTGGSARLPSTGTPDVAMRVSGERIGSASTTPSNAEFRSVNHIPKDVLSRESNRKSVPSLRSPLYRAHQRFTGTSNLFDGSSRMTDGRISENRRTKENGSSGARRELETVVRWGSEMGSHNGDRKQSEANYVAADDDNRTPSRIPVNFCNRPKSAILKSNRLSGCY